ncbi:hypothetical protein F5883DRAFT_169984 [Diaporthe sp. PMI_573]|nr:hypothetical protein F5883DRAFT_169984 [Diaporthaceae sp. PMI_573]
MKQRNVALSDVRRRMQGQGRTGNAENRTPAQDWEDAVDAVGEVLCPYCFHMIPAREATDDFKWRCVSSYVTYFQKSIYSLPFLLTANRRHVLGDLDAYICLFEQCEFPNELYNHSNQWLKHMREHTLQWRCASMAHAEFVVTSRDEYTEHMKTVHQSRLTDAQLRILADKSCRTPGKIFGSCPLCGVEETHCSMEEHITGHLRHYAIKSLPAAYESVESSGPNEVSSVISAIRSRSTVKDLLEEDFEAGETSLGNEFADDDDGNDGESPNHSSTPHMRHFSPPPESDVSPTGKIGEVLEPNCVICGIPALSACRCEAIAFEECVRQVESKIMAPLHIQAHEWVRTHAEKQVTASLLASTSQLASAAAAGGDSAAQNEATTAQGHAIKAAAGPTDLKINNLRCDADQVYPVLEYFYSLVDYTLPEDDDPLVRDPPLSALSGRRKARRASKPYEVPEPIHPPRISFSEAFTAASGRGVTLGETAAMEEKGKEKAGNIDPPDPAIRVNTRARSPSLEPQSDSKRPRYIEDE